MSAEFGTPRAPIANLVGAHKAVGARALRLVPAVGAADFPSDHEDGGAKAVALEDGKRKVGQVGIAVVER